MHTHKLTGNMCNILMYTYDDDDDVRASPKKSNVNGKLVYNSSISIIMHCAAAAFAGSQVMECIKIKVFMNQQPTYIFTQNILTLIYIFTCL